MLFGPNFGGTAWSSALRLRFLPVTRHIGKFLSRGTMTPPAERMRAMRERRRRRGLRELRLVVPDARSRSIRRRIAAQVARLGRNSERDALDWIEAVSECDDDAAR